MSTPRAPPPRCLSPWLRRERRRTRSTSAAVWTSLSVRPARITPDTPPLTAASLPLCQAKKRSMNPFSTPCSANYYAPAGCSESDSTALHVGGSPNPLTSRAGENNAGRAVSSRGVVSLCVHGEIQAVNQVAPLPSATATPRQVVARATATRFTSAAVLTSSSAGPARTTPDAPSLAVASLLAALTVGRKSPISSTLRAPGESDSKHACVGSGLANLECDADKKNAWTRRHKR